MSVRVRKIPATRGAIFDSNGVKLAWTQRYYSLYLESQKLSKIQKNRIYNRLKIIFPRVKPIERLAQYPNRKTLIKECLSPQELKYSLDLINSTSSLSIEPYFVRENNNNPNVNKCIGRARFINGKWVGITGLEKKFNTFLNGEDGLYTVMLDKKGQWINGSSSTKKIMIPGNNLYLEESIDDIIKKYKIY